jgi:hypothetical protein
MTRVTENSNMEQSDLETWFPWKEGQGIQARIDNGLSSHVRLTGKVHISILGASNHKIPSLGLVSLTPTP